MTQSPQAPLAGFLFADTKEGAVQTIESCTPQMLRFDM
jgi:hypothetical protein